MPLTRLVAGVLGGVYLVAGLAGFFATGFGGSGHLLLFALSPLHNALHLALGAAGLACAWFGAKTSRMFGQIAGGLLAALAVTGVVFHDPFGVLPIGGFDVVLHTVTALALLYPAFVLADGKAPRETGM